MEHLESLAFENCVKVQLLAKDQCQRCICQGHQTWTIDAMQRQRDEKMSMML